MALINNHYIFVESEEVQHNIEVSIHPVEKGIDITDHVKRVPMILSLSGKFIGKDADSIIEAIKALHDKGKLVKYIGINVLSQAQILSFTTTHSNQIMGGCEFNMELKEVRFAKSSYQNKKTKETTKAGTQQIESKKTGKVYHTVKKGETAYSIGKKYASYGSSMNFIVKNNPDAPKKRGDWTTLQISTKLWVYSK